MQNLKSIETMNKEELLKAYEIGKSWVFNHSQVIGTAKNVLGEPYNNTMFVAGLKKLEELEAVLQERGIDYGGTVG